MNRRPPTKVCRKRLDKSKTPILQTFKDQDFEQHNDVLFRLPGDPSVKDINLGRIVASPLEGIEVMIFSSAD